MKKYEEEYLSGNLTAMIDVVFQLIIFFVCTANMQDKAIDTHILLAMAPHGEEVKMKDPLEINVDVDAKGNISIAREPFTKAMLVNTLKKAVADWGVPIPVIIRGDADATHDSIRKVMDACAEAHIWKIKFAALKEKG
jgi:biopolymer transport protein ExbD